MKERSGVALLAALMLLSLLALFTAGIFSAASAVRRDGGLAKADAVVMGNAELSLVSATSAWAASALPLLSVGQTQVLVLPGSEGVLDSAAVTRLPLDVYWLVAASQEPAQGARRRLNLLLRLPVLQSLPGAPLTSAGDVGIGPGVVFDQDTSHQGGASCGGGPVDVSLGLGAKLILEPGGTLGSIVTANQQSSGDTTTYALGPEGWPALSQRAVSYAPGAHTIIAPAPIVYGSGDLTIDGGSGAGLLLIAGHANIDGAFTFRGLIVARGGISITAPADITGAIMSADPGGTPVDLESTAVHFSMCAVTTAAMAAALPRPVKGRAWLEMF